MAKQIIPLTDSKCSGAKPKEKDYSLYDGNGLILYIRKSGTKVWRYKYKKANGKDGLMTLGNFPSLTLKQARDKRREYEKLLAQNIDPIEHEATQKVKKSDAFSFEAVARDWHKEYTKTGRWIEHTSIKALRVLESYVFPLIGDNTASDRNELVAKVLSHLDDIDFDISNTEADVLGDAYEYLIGEFASGAGKKAGEFYTPQSVSTLLAKIVTQGKDRLRSVYDPTCGSGSLLLRVKREVKDVDMIYGQEMNRTTYNLARMNMILHDVHFAKFDIKQEDTLIRPQHLDKRFDAVVANPPFSAKWSADPLFLQDERFSSYGKLAPSSKADMAFVQHMLHHLDENGTMAVVLPHGVLFRGSSEGVIRQYLIEQMNVIDTIIGLPANIFYGTSIPTCILVLKKDREHKDNILFIDASNEFEKQKTQNKLLPEHLDHIIGAFENRQNIEKYAKVATLQEVKDNDFNLNIPRYVDTFEVEAEIDLDAIAKQLQALEVESQKTDTVIAEFCKELGINSPFAEVK